MRISDTDGILSIRYCAALCKLQTIMQITSAIAAFILKCIEFVRIYADHNWDFHSNFWHDRQLQLIIINFNKIYLDKYIK